MITQGDRNGRAAGWREEKQRSRSPPGGRARGARVATGVSGMPPLISSDATLSRRDARVSNEAERARDAGRSNGHASSVRQLTHSTDEGGDTVMAKKTAKKAATKKAGKKR